MADCDDVAARVWRSLVEWVEQSREPHSTSETVKNATVNPNLELRRIGVSDSNRGVFCSGALPIRQGDVLIQLPMRLAVHGKSMPESYTVDLPSSPADGKRPPEAARSAARPVSNWLRCLAAYMRIVSNHALPTDLDTSALKPAMESESIRGNHPSLSQSDFAPYLASLPHTYDTLWTWTESQLAEFLAGTHPPNSSNNNNNSSSTSRLVGETHDGTSPASSFSAWSTMDSNAVRQGYLQRIRPYLVHCNIVANNNPVSTAVAVAKDEATIEAEFQAFARACQVIATRSFYLVAENDDPAPSDVDVDRTVSNSKVQQFPYSGPYLLPIMDLLNHAYRSTGSTDSTAPTASVNAAASRTRSAATAATSCTSVQLVDGCFCMIAERDIAVGEEVLHSYGNDLTSQQFLASYGFIPRDLMERAAATGMKQAITAASTSAPAKLTDSSLSATKSLPPLTPVVLAKRDVWDACWRVIESSVPEQLAKSMQDNEIEDETWALVVDQTRQAAFVPDHIVISATPTVEAAASAAVIDEEDARVGSVAFSFLTDELVTAACVPFLPRCAYAEITLQTLLDRSILQDYFLGKLVGTALIDAVQRRMAAYRPISQSTRNRLGLSNSSSFAESVTTSTDASDNSNGSSYEDDGQLLLSLLARSEKQQMPGDDATLEQECLRLAYGLTIRIEEKRILKDLLLEIVEHLRTLDEEVEELPAETNGSSFKKLRQGL